MADLMHSQLLAFSGAGSIPENISTVYTHLETDSRKMDAQGVFFALPGVATQGWEYLDQVVELGGRVAIVPKDQLLQRNDIELVHVDNPADVLVSCLNHMQGMAPKNIVAVTGTNGKSSICFYLAQLAQAVGYSSGLIGTFGVGPLGALRNASQTTPNLLDLHQELIGMANHGVDFVAFEASSHALDQNRLFGVPFQTAVFSNLSRDHLDYHGDMASYAEAKRRLFSFPSVQRAVICLDDGYASYMAEAVPSGCQTFYYSTANRDADFYVHSLVFEPTGCRFILCHPGGESAVFLPLLGRFNIQNALSALACMWSLVSDKQALIGALVTLQGAPGRMQEVARSEGLFKSAPTVVVDYAHTPDALKVALEALKEHSAGRVVCVFGCGGDRDKGKRPIMLNTALEYADLVWLTSDNPRTETPEQIIQDAIDGVLSGDHFEVAVDRRDAISRAIQRSRQGDIVLIAGKGHETYQDVQGVKHHFDDVEEALRGLSQC